MKMIRVCNGPNCASKDSKGIMDTILNFFGLKSVGKNDKVDVDYCRCLGFCSEAPNVAVDDKFIINTSPEKIVEDIKLGGKKREDISAYRIDFDEDFLSL